MKIRQKIEKKQVGGIIYTPFLPSYQDNASQTPTQETETNTGKIGDIQKEILEVLQENGLPSDVNLFLNKATSFLRRAEMTGEWSMSDFARVQAMANMVAHNKGLYDAATQHLTETGNWNEIALNDRGQMYVMDKEGKVSAINPDEYYKNQKKYSPLTNNYILEYRSQATPFDSSVLNSMSGSIGVNDVVNYAKSIILDFGTRSISGYTNSELAKMEESLYGLIAGGPQGYYKFKQEAQIDNSTAQQAINYIYNALPTNMKQLLRAKTAAEGQDPNLHSADLLIQALSNHLDSSTSVDYDSTATASDPKYADVTTSSTTKEDTYLEHLTTGNTLGNYQDFRITPLGSSVSLHVKGQNGGPLIDRQGDAIQQNNLRELFRTAYGFQITDTDSVTFGSQLVKPQDYDKLVWDGSSQIIRVFLPYTQTENGKIVPNFQLIEQIDEFQKEIDAMGGQITPNIQQQLREYFGDVVFFNPTTKKLQVNDRYVKPFLSISAYANSHTMGNLDTSDSFLTSLDRETGKAIKADYENATEYYMMHGDELGKDRLVKQSAARKNRFYKGNIFIPITGRTIGTHLTSGQEIPKSTYSDVNGNDANQDIITTW